MHGAVEQSHEEYSSSDVFDVIGGVHSPVEGEQQVPHLLAVG